MTPPLEKIKTLELSMSKESGDFELFGVFLRDDSPERWDLVVSAPWLDPDKRESLQSIVSGLQRSLSAGELLGFSRIVVLEKGNPFLEGIIGAFDVEHDMSEIVDSDLFGIQIRRAYIITARRRLVRKRRRDRKNSPTK